MTGEQTSHITIIYRDYGNEFTLTYAVDETTLNRALREVKEPTGKALKIWLEDRGCRLDSPDGPALLIRNAEGSTEDYYYRDGELHRDDGPAIVKRFADASSEERYCRSGKLHREDGPAFVHRNADGTTRVEEYFRDGKTYLPSLCVIPGVTVRHAPKGPGPA
jgi:hypothetical protein